MPLGGERPTGVRYLVLLLLALAAASAYLTRVLGAVNTTIAEELGYDDDQMGAILAGFFVGYVWLQVPGGWLGGRCGLRRVLPVMSVLGSLAAVWTSLSRSGDSMWWSRVALGVAQAGLIPCSAKALADWFPVTQRGVASAAVAASMQIGALLALGVTPLLLPLVGNWRAVYLGFALVGVAWAVVFYLVYRERPAEHPWTNLAERELIRGGPVAGRVAASDTPRAPADGSVSRPTSERSVDVERNSFRSAGENGINSVLRLDEFRDGETGRRVDARWTAAAVLALAMLTSGSMWALCAQAYCRAFGYDFFTSWFPAYLEKARGVARMSSSLLAMLPLVGVGLGSAAGGFVVDFVLARTGSKRASRSGTAVVALALCAVCTLATAWATDHRWVVVVISCGTFCAGLAGPATWAAIMDISGRHTAIVSGIQNMVGNFGAGSCSFALGHLFSYIQRSGTDWNLVLYLFVAIYLAGAVFWLLLNPERSAVERPKTQASGVA